ncbi:MAG: methyltransferase domain-containing protein [Afipia sp.]|nr:methyltransferase domain-containing protein [Afipia sp.]OJW63121.1 MAG: SAM-dependent methyltransferase [Afipia sp. 64-13]
MNDIAGPIHHAAAKGYTSKAEMYARGRPDYPPEILDWLRERLGLEAGKSVVDLGAGTGKFTRYLARTGARVIAVEPVRQMREQLAKALPEVEVLEGTATALPLPDNSVDALTCAQSFHWFATRAALAEIHRVLKPGGRLGLIWNMRDEDIEWIGRLSEIIAPYEGDAPRFAKGTWRQVFPFEGLTPLQEDHFHHAHTGAPEDVIINRLRSVSFIAALPADEEAKVVAKMRALIDATPALAGKDEISVPYSTVAYWAEKIA